MNIRTEVSEGTVFDALAELECEVSECGSRVTCDPIPESADQDYLVLCPDNDGTVSTIVTRVMGKFGFDWEGSEHYQMAACQFMSWRSKDNVNLIITRSPEFHRRHLAATEVCKRLNLLEKADRIALFQAVLYGNSEAAE